jgi:hypothetical protein
MQIWVEKWIEFHAVGLGAIKKKISRKLNRERAFKCKSKMYANEIVREMEIFAWKCEHFVMNSGLMSLRLHSPLYHLADSFLMCVHSSYAIQN